MMWKDAELWNEGLMTETLALLVLHFIAVLEPFIQAGPLLGSKTLKDNASPAIQGDPHHQRRGSFRGFAWMVTIHSGFSCGNCLDP